MICFVSLAIGIALLAFASLRCGIGQGVAVVGAATAISKTTRTVRAYSDYYVYWFGIY